MPPLLIFRATRFDDAVYDIDSAIRLIFDYAIFFAAATIMLLDIRHVAVTTAMPLFRHCRCHILICCRCYFVFSMLMPIHGLPLMFTPLAIFFLILRH